MMEASTRGERLAYDHSERRDDADELSGASRRPRVAPPRDLTFEESYPNP